MVNQSRGPYNMPPADRDVDNMTYNPQADARPDNAAFDESTNPDIHPVGARGADTQPTYRDYRKEDKETAHSDETGQIPRSEVDDLLSSVSQDERDVSGRTRGKKVDAYKQERDVDQFLDEAGISSAEQDVEIGRATGR
ncbi:hypothetical protein BN946_scf184934.g8 [Trametes cinnabarina]|uniref:Uncharacterized protein n=1 Tax=Pycnoporus cinnabarinus TaxID=5643 RepID=A0A060STP8_PYCCI|nr:hypothetical protein BN946_scf184934.g8 [Trametes cinnabarina]